MLPVRGKQSEEVFQSKVLGGRIKRVLHFKIHNTKGLIMKISDTVAPGEEIHRLYFDVTISM